MAGQDGDEPNQDDVVDYFEAEKDDGAFGKGDV